MAEGRTEAIQKAFDGALVTFGASNGISVSLENIDTPTSTSTPYLNGFMFPAPSSVADLYFTDMLTGIYQIDVNYSSEIGSASINRMIDKLNTTFKTGADITRGDYCVTITAFDYSQLIIENGWAKKSISLTWITHTARL